MGIGLTEVLILLAIALVLFGGKKIPQLGRTLGESIKEFKKGLSTPLENNDKKEDKKES